MVNVVDKMSILDLSAKINSTETEAFLIPMLIMKSVNGIKVYLNRPSLAALTMNNIYPLLYSVFILKWINSFCVSFCH